MSTDKEPIPVVAAVICREGKYLLCLRPSHKRHGGLWEFPGGKIRYGESLADAVHRELSEELGLDAVGIGTLRHSISDPGSRFVIQFIDVEADGEPQAREHDSIAWVGVDDLADYKLAPSDQEFAHQLRASAAEGLGGA